MATTRLAPSPTGALHLGNLRSFWVTWAWARSTGARLVFRMEDLDGPRRKPGAAEQVLEDLRWAGLDWDGPVVVQSERAAAHRAALDHLLQAGLVYPCICSRADIESAASAPHGDQELTYPGTCRGRFASVNEAHASGATQVALRMRVPPGVVVFSDAVRGAVGLDPSVLGGDFVLARRHADGRLDIAYQLAVVVDDAAMGVDFVIRGDDLLTSVPRQRLLQRALGLPEPSYAHLPLVVGEDGRRLAKRHGDTRVAAYREAGVPKERLLAWVVQSLGPGAVGERAEPAPIVHWAALRRTPTVVRAHRIFEGPPEPTWRDPSPAS